MEQILNIATYIDTYLFLMILLAGIFITKYTRTIKVIPNTYKVLIASTIMSVIAYYVQSCDGECVPKYVFTYPLATSFYEVAAKGLKNIINNKLGK